MNAQKQMSEILSEEELERMKEERESMDGIQQMRREYLQARREEEAPSSEELEARRRGPEYDPRRMPMKNPDPRVTPHYKDVERQYASLPR
ncbi:partitioning defective 3 homolog B-like [Carassius auratus]|uniref:Partitioning defective 3 homolog B-like n=1 Tax=Carassius auratus TaxID=7957 RepID=A0A6P6P872_CARAU|nr:partitioning defective 3 homolog B-like [Carassius auratus]